MRIKRKTGGSMTHIISNDSPKERHIAAHPADYIVGSFLVAVVILALLGYI